MPAGFADYSLVFSDIVTQNNILGTYWYSDSKLTIVNGFRGVLLSVNRKELSGPGSIFRCPHMELWATPPSGLDGLHPGSAGPEKTRKALVAICAFMRHECVDTYLEQSGKSGRYGGVI